MINNDSQAAAPKVDSTAPTAPMSEEARRAAIEKEFGKEGYGNLDELKKKQPKAKDIIDDMLKSRLYEEMKHSEEKWRKRIKELKR